MLITELKDLSDSSVDQPYPPPKRYPSGNVVRGNSCCDEDEASRKGWFGYHCVQKISLRQ